MKIDKVVMTTDADVKTEKVEAPIDVDVDSMITIDNDCLYRRSVLDDMDLVEESFSLLNEAADIPKDFVDFAHNFYNDLRDEFDTAKNAVLDDIKKAKAKNQYAFHIKNFKATDPSEIKKAIAKKYGMIKLFGSDEDAIFGKISGDKKYIFALTHVDIKKELAKLVVTCYKISEALLKKVNKSDDKEAKDYLKKNLDDKDKSAYEKYLEGSTPRPDMIMYNTPITESHKERTHDENYLKLINEYCDLSDREFKNRLMYVNEAEQNKVLMSLTAKLYATIVDKSNEIDYGDIPNTKGDITKLQNYNTMMETVKVLHDIVKEFKQDTKPVDVISEAIANLQTHKDEFTKAYRMGIELPQLIYMASVVAILDSISYMISTCIEFIKTPGTDTFKMTLDTMRYKKSKDHLTYTNLEMLNREFKKGNISKVINTSSKARAKDSLNEAEGSGEGSGKLKKVVAIGILALFAAGLIFVLFNSILNLIRRIVFLHYNLKMSMAEYWDMQAMMLEANANSIPLNHPEMSEEQQKKIIERQMKYVERWRKRAESKRIAFKKAEADTDRDLSNINKMSQEEFDDASNYSSLF